MANETATKTGQQKTAQPTELKTVGKPNYTIENKYLVFEYAQKRTSKNGYTREDTIGTANPITINHPRTFILLPRSKHFLGAGHGSVKTQYIPGADTIFVDDYVGEDGKPRKGLKSQGYDLDDEYRRQRLNGLLIEFNSTGILDIRRHDNDPALVAFLNSHEQNEESAFGKQNFRTVVGTHKFRPLRKEEKATEKVVDFDAQFDAMTALNSLRTKKADGNYTYNENEMNAYLRILGVVVENKYGTGEAAQKFTYLVDASKKDPAMFLSLIKRGIDEVVMNMAKAASLGIASVDAIGIDVSIDGKKRTIHTFTDKVSADELPMASAIAMISTANLYNEYNAIKRAIESAK